MSNLKINSSLLCKLLTYAVSYKTGENGRNLTKKTGKRSKKKWTRLLTNGKISENMPKLGKPAKIIVNRPKLLKNGLQLLNTD